MGPADEHLTAPLSRVTVMGLGVTCTLILGGGSICAKLHVWPANPQGAQLSVPVPAASAVSLPALLSRWPFLAGGYPRLQLRPESPVHAAPPPFPQDWLQKYRGPSARRKCVQEVGGVLRWRQRSMKPSTGPSECWVPCDCTGRTPVKRTPLPQQPPRPRTCCGEDSLC